MAAAAGVMERQTQEFNWEQAEAQFSRANLAEHAPETEIYGRSLSTIRRLGALMTRKALRTHREIIQSPEADQARVEFYTSVEEGFGTDMELGGGLEVRDFDARPVINGRVMSKDLKTAVSAMTEAGLKCAVSTGEKDRRFLPQLVRSEWDHENALIADKMARGETNYNTRIVISPFPEEAAQRSGNEYWRNIGYVPHLKRGFVQLYHATKDGVLVTGSLSFDGSDKRQLREVLSRFGVEVPEHEITDNWLRYAVTATFSEGEAKRVATEIADQASGLSHQKNANTVEVTRKYRAVMDSVFNESYVHICESLFRRRQTKEARELIFQLSHKAQHFNKRYREALYRMRADENQFTDDDSVVLHELIVYSTIEMMRALHLGKAKLPQIPGAQLIKSTSLQEVLGYFGAEGARYGRIYSACGLSIGLGEDGGESPQSVFGGKANGEKDDCEFVSKECPKCHAKDVKTVVKKGRYYGACGCKS